MNNVTFRGTVTKIFKSGFVCEIPPRTEKGFSVGVWVKQGDGALQPNENEDVIVVGALSTSKGKNGAPPQLCVYAFEVVPVSGSEPTRANPEDDDPPF